eukprot:6126199-Pleurochrysis_carterae.AAC.2
MSRVCAVVHRAPFACISLCKIISERLSTSSKAVARAPLVRSPFCRLYFDACLTPHRHILDAARTHV